MTFRIGDNDRFVTLHNRYARVRSTQINTDNLSHNLKLLFRFQFIIYSFCPVSPTEPSRAPKRAKVIPNGFSDGNIRPVPPQPAKNAPPTDKMAVERSSSDRRNDSPHAKSAPAAKPRKSSGDRTPDTDPSRRRISLRPPALRRRRRLQTETGAAEFRKKWSFSEIYARILPPEFVKFKLIP